MQCDLGRPGCLRCEKYGVVCPGYRAELDLLFRHEDAGSVVRRTKTKRRGPSGPRTPTRTSPGAEKDQPGDAGPSSDLRLSYFQHGGSLAAVLDRFAEPPSQGGGGGGGGLIAVLPSLFQEAQNDSCLGLVADLFAHVHKTGRSDAAYKSSRSWLVYGKALRSINAALASPQKRLEDQTIVAIWLMGHCEIIVRAPHDAPQADSSAPPAWHGAWRAHMDGLASVLLARGPKQFTTMQGRHVFWLMFTFIQIRAVVSNTAFPPAAAAWLKEVHRELRAEERLLYALSAYNTEACSILSSVAELEHNKDRGGPQAAACASILERIDTLEETAPDRAKLLSSGGGHTGHMWNMHASVRLKLLHAKVAMLWLCQMFAGTSDQVKYSVTDLERQRTAAVRAAQNTAEVILSSAPDLIARGGKGDDTATGGRGKPGAWANATRLVFPLTLVQRLPSLLPRQRAEADEILQFLSVRFQIPTTLTQAPNAQSFPREALWLPALSQKGVPTQGPNNQISSQLQEPFGPTQSPP
ncbi:hypothetical protein GQ53DRAFT_834653 [Thozetella sp. PMI_491]|nr:hypothetical protein GQ53DRAFT_834653 [Thozetella sp. PMI_491]